MLYLFFSHDSEYSEIAMFVAVMIITGFILIRYVLGYRQHAASTDSVAIANTLGLGFLFNKFDITQTKVEWDWVEPITVGQSMMFKLFFFKNNGRPYSAGKVTNLQIKILCRSLTIAHVSEVVENRNEGNNETVVESYLSVSFLVRASGVYSISITHYGTPLQGSPFIKVFLPLEPVASRTLLIRPMESCKFLPVTQNQSFLVDLEPRDEFGNNSTDVQDATRVRERLDMLLTDMHGDLVPWSTDIIIKKDVVTLDIFVPMSGCFHAIIKLNGDLIINGDFDLISLTPKESARSKDNLSKQNLNVYYEAKLQEDDDGHHVKIGQFSRTQSMGDMPSSTSFFDTHKRKRSTNMFNRTKKVYIYITPKQIIVKEFFLKFIPRRLQSFRICQGTQMSITEVDGSCKNISICDGFQAPCYLQCDEANTVLATFFGILSQNTGGSRSFDDKKEYFYEEVLNHNKLSKYNRSTINIPVDRNNLLQTSYKATKHLSEADWCKQFVVQFLNEEGLDWGGLNREWIEELCGALFNPPYEEERNQKHFQIFQRFKNEGQGLVLPRPCKDAFALKYYEFAGKLMAKCIVESAMGGEYKRQINAKFARSFLAQIIGLVVTFRHFESDDPELYKTKIRYIIENDVSDLELTFSDEVYDARGTLQETVSLKSNGIRIDVTNNSKFEYLNLLAQYRLSKSIKNEVEAILKGINFLIPDHLLGIFDENELELIICGSSKIAVSDLKNNCTLNDHSDNFKRIMTWFWAMISNFTQDELAGLMQFTTGCSLLPTGGFKDLKPQFKISFSYYNSNTLPTAHTCFNELCLPMYDSYETMHKMLKLAINEGATGFGLA